MTKIYHVEYAGRHGSDNYVIFAHNPEEAKEKLQNIVGHLKNSPIIDELDPKEKCVHHIHRTHWQGNIIMQKLYKIVAIMAGVLTHLNIKTYRKELDRIQESTRFPNVGYRGER